MHPWLGNITMCLVHLTTINKQIYRTICTGENSLKLEWEFAVHTLHVSTSQAKGWSLQRASQRWHCSVGMSFHKITPNTWQTVDERVVDSVVTVWKDSGGHRQIWKTINTLDKIDIVLHDIDSQMYIPAHELNLLPVNNMKYSLPSWTMNADKIATALLLLVCCGLQVKAGVHDQGKPCRS